ncbi:MAG TPA: hypothetical protein V6D47_11420 [Oscillatoriaceae cyanobacterium]
MAIASEALADVYARYFFSVFDACLNEDGLGLRQAQETLEDYLHCHLEGGPQPVGVEA